MESEQWGLPKRKCVSLIQIVCAAVSAGGGMGESVSLAEATDALNRAYQQGDPVEMLHDGLWETLTNPYSAKFAPLTGVVLENKMIDEVRGLLSDRWWELPNPANGTSREKIKKYESILVSKNDAEAIWRRLWPILFDGAPAVLDQFISLDPFRYPDTDSINCAVADAGQSHESHAKPSS